MAGVEAPDDLSGWEAAPPAARARGSADLIRVFDSAEAAIAFLARHVDSKASAASVMASALPAGTPDCYSFAIKRVGTGPIGRG